MLKGMRREREEARLLLREDLRDGVIALLGMGPLVRDLVAPPPKLRIEVVDVAKGPRGEEGVPQILNLALDFAFGESRQLPSKGWSVIELKEGTMNEVLSDVLRAKEGKLSEQDIAEITDKMGVKAAKQAQRMVRQQARAENFRSIVNDDHGRFPVLDLPVVVDEERVYVEDYPARLCSSRNGRNLPEEDRRHRTWSREAQISRQEPSVHARRPSVGGHMFST